MADVLAAMRMTTQILFTLNSSFLDALCADNNESSAPLAGTESHSHNNSSRSVAVASWLALESRRNDLTLLRQGLGSASRNRSGFENSPFDDYFNWGAAIGALRPLCDQGSFVHKLLHLPPIV